MSNQISTFNFKSNPVRIEVINNEPHFCLTDVCEALAINNANSSRFNINEAGIHKMYISHSSGRKLTTFINEPNLYRIIFRSNKTEAVEFQNWVFEEVLPQIRKTGQYSQNQQQNLPLVTTEADEEALKVITSLYHALAGGYELAQLLHKPEHHYLRKRIDNELGGHYIHNLYRPTENALTKAKKYVHAKSERIMYIKGMLSLLEAPTPKTNLRQTTDF